MAVFGSMFKSAEGPGAIAGAGLHNIESKFVRIAAQPNYLKGLGQ
jgi:hypothetical protein